MRTQVIAAIGADNVNNGSWLARGDETGAIYMMVGWLGTVLIPGTYPADKVGKQLRGGGFTRLPPGSKVILEQ